MDNYGRFIGTVKSEWIEPDRKMKLLDDFVYVDPNDNPWKAPKYSIIDGASIPRPLWTMVGSPFSGKYRNASVVHDVACVQKSVPSEKVHRMFYYACRCGGVRKAKAKLMLWAVRKFGPSWGGPRASITSPRAPISDSDIIKEFEVMEHLIESEDPSIERIEELSTPY